MQNTLRVLSIDFDFFQNVTKETICNCYPDGIDLPTEVTKIIWAAHYANPRNKTLLDKVTPDKENLKILKSILHKNKPYIAMIQNSHIHCYDFILDYLYNKPNIKGVELYNIDMHHDIFNRNPELDCGNWIGMLRDQILMSHQQLKVTWIANKTSKDAYAIPQNLENIIKYTLDCISDKEFDLVFLCRSDPWTPPHLDGEFAKLTTTVIKNATKYTIEHGITAPRFDTEFNHVAKQITGYYNNIQQKCSQ